MTPTKHNRRRFLQAMGATGALAIAGCLAPDGDDTTQASDDDQNDASDDGEDESLPAAKDVDVDRIAADPTDVPDPVDWDEPREHDLTIRTEELTAEIEPGVTFDYMTFEGQVPGPMVRVRRGDRINLTFEVPEDVNADMHNVDFHAVYGPGGAAEHTTIAPGDDAAEVSFTAEYAGVHIYHCAVPNMDHHISAGMYGAILVEPEEGLPEVDRELYFGQNEIYTDGDAGEEGHHTIDMESMANEEPTYVTLNGEAYAFTPDGYGPITVDKGETVRIYYSNGGPNHISSWHAIGNVWSRLYRDGDLHSEPSRNVETTPVGPGTVTAAEIETPVPGPIKIVDHALSRVVWKGMLGVIQVEGEEEPGIYDSDP